MDQEVNPDAAAAPPSNVIDFSTFMARRNAKLEAGVAVGAGVGAGVASADECDQADDGAPPSSA